MSESEIAHPHQRVWFQPIAGLDREELYDRVAGFLMREKPEEASLWTLDFYPPGEGASEDPRIVTISWRLSYEIDDAAGRDWDWGHEISAGLAALIESSFGSPEATDDPG